MIYLVKYRGLLKTFTSKTAFDLSGIQTDEFLEVSDEDFNACGNKSYLDDNGMICLGENPKITKQRKINELTRYLEETDYIDNKIIEGDATREDYAEIIEKRKQTRKELSKLKEN